MELQPYSNERKKALVDEIAQRIFEQIRIHGGRDLDAIIQRISNFQIPETVVELNHRGQKEAKVNQKAPIQLEDKKEWNLTPGAAVPTPKPVRSTVESAKFQSEKPRRPSPPSPNLQRSLSNVQLSNRKPPIGSWTNSLPRADGAPKRPRAPSAFSVSALRRSQSSQRITLRPDDFWLKPRASSRSSSLENLPQSDHRVYKYDPRYFFAFPHSLKIEIF